MQVRAQLDSMSDAQIEALGAASGQRLTRAQLAGGDWAANMSADQLERMAAMQQQLQSGCAQCLAAVSQPCWWCWGWW
jgi:hypothetical protein